MAMRHFQVVPSMAVIGADGEPIGQIKAVRGDEFLVDRRLQRDLYLPCSVIQAVHGNHVVLTVTAVQLDDLASLSPPITGGPGTTYQPADDPDQETR
jgi:hypothetical protein